MTVRFSALLFACLLIVATDASAKTLRFATSEYVPPYVMDGPRQGLEIDLTRAALAETGFAKAEFVKVSNARAVREIELEQVDAIITTQDLADRVYYSDPLLFFDDVVVSLTARSFHIRSLQDLQGKSVMAFQNATATLGDEFAAVIRQSDYAEVYNQQAQVAQLLKGRVDVIVLERRIFLHYLSQYKELLTPGMLTLHQPFTPIPRRVAFKEETLRNTFNQGLQRLVKSGRYEELLNSYRDARLDFAFSAMPAAR